MKATIIVLSLVVCAVSSAAAQSTQGYWVIETNPLQSHSTIIKIYDMEHQLVRQDTLVNKVLSASRKRDQKFLNRKVDDTMRLQALAWRRDK